MISGIHGFGGGPEGIHENLKKPSAEQGFSQKTLQKRLKTLCFDHPQNLKNLVQNKVLATMLKNLVLLHVLTPPRNQWIP